MKSAARPTFSCGALLALLAPCEVRARWRFPRDLNHSVSAIRFARALSRGEYLSEHLTQGRGEEIALLRVCALRADGGGELVDDAVDLGHRSGELD